MERDENTDVLADRVVSAIKAAHARAAAAEEKRDVDLRADERGYIVRGDE